MTNNRRAMPPAGLSLVFALSFALAACGGSAATPAASRIPSAVQHGSLMVDGQQRTYFVFRPPSLDPKQQSPLVLVLHGYTVDAAWMEATTNFDDQAKKGGFMAAYPEGIGRSWNAGSCCGDAQSQKLDDVAFIKQLIDRLASDGSIDRKRVFVAGLSNGAIMAYRLACDLSDRIAGIASVAGSMGITECHPAQPVSVLEMHGTKDSIVLYDGGKTGLGTFPSANEVIKGWVTADGCAGNPILSQSGITKTSVWNGCRAGTIVRLDTVAGGHHTWFGSTFDPVPGEPNANAVIWDFFSHLAPRG